MVKFAVLLTPEYEAVRTTGVVIVTLPPITENVADVEPGWTMTVDGTPAAAPLELESETTTPPEPAGAVRFMVTVADCVLAITVGLTAMLLKAVGAGLIVRPKVSFTPRYDAVSVTGVGVVTLPGVAANVVDVAP